MTPRQPLLQGHVGVWGELRECPKITLLLLIVPKHEAGSVYGLNSLDEDIVREFRGFPFNWFGSCVKL